MSEPQDSPDISLQKSGSPSDSPQAPTADAGSPTAAPTYPYGGQPGGYPNQMGHYPTQPAFPQAGYPQAGYPQPGYPQSGYPQPGYPQPPSGLDYAPPAVKNNGLGTASLVIAIAALFLFCTVLGGVICGFVAVVLGFVGIGRVRRGEADNRGVAIAGVVLGFLAIVASVVLTVIAFTFFWGLGFGSYSECLAAAGNDQQEVQKCIDEFESNLEDRFSTTIDVPTPTP